MRTISCPSCEEEITVLKDGVARKGKCPACGTRIYVPGSEQENPTAIAASSNQAIDSNIEKEQSFTDWLSNQKARWKTFRMNRMVLEWPFEGKHLRRCSECANNQFTVSRPCNDCGGQTVGMDLTCVVTGTDMLQQKAAFDYEKTKKSMSSSKHWIWIPTALVCAISVLFKGGLGTLIAMLLVIGAGFFHASILICFRARFMKKHVSEEASNRHTLPSFEKTLEDLADTIMEPFLDRIRAYEGRSVNLPSNEAELLVKLVGAKGVHLSFENCLIFVAAFALRRDFRLFHERLNNIDKSMSDPTKAYACLIPENEDQEKLPFLRQVMSERGESSRLDDNIPKVSKIRGALEMKGFAKDLELRRNQQGMSISLDQVDRMNPFCGSSPK
jgi:hypothetical protein